jgi:tetratricopeptide (TPR) repeat protein
MERKSLAKMTARRALAAGWILVLVAAILGGCAKQARHPAEKVYLHRMTDGETLADVAEDYYGDPERAPAIEEFNGIAGEPVKPGMVVRVPMTAKDVERLMTREKAKVPYDKGLELAEKASYVDAVQSFQEAVALDPEFADAVYNLGVTLGMLKSYEKAKEPLERAAAMRPKNAPYVFALGNCLFHLGDYPGAIGAFEKVAVLDPSNTKALYSLAVSYEKQGQKDEARKTWQRYLELDSTSAWATEARKRLEALK